MVMTMIKDEKGYGLILTMLVTTVIAVIGLTVVAASLQGSIRTELRETDVNITYETKKVLEQMIADLRLELSQERLPANVLESPLFKNHLDTLLETLEGKYSEIEYQNAGIKSVEIEDISSQYSIDANNLLTRVLQITLVTTNPEEGQGEITRTVKKRAILSPLPSFLQYAVGSLGDDEDSGLILNGSPTLQGNVYAQRLQLDQLAQFWPSDRADTEDPEYIFTPYPEIIGDVYSNSVNPFIDASFKTIDREDLSDNFYNEKVPDIKNDSNFIEINFNGTFEQRTNELLDEIAPSLDLNTIQVDDTLENSAAPIQTNIRTNIHDYVEDSVPDNNESVVNIDDLLGTLLLGGDTQLDLNEVKGDISGKVVKGSFDLSNVSDNALNSLKVVGNLSLNSIRDLTITNGLFVNGDLTISNYAHSKLDLNKVFADGKITIFNKGGEVTISNDIASSSTIQIVNEAGGIIKFENPQQGALITNNIEIINVAGEILLNKPIVTSGNFSIENSSSSNQKPAVVLDVPSFIGGDVLLRPLDSAISITNNLITTGDFSIIGNDDNGTHEDDDTIFNSVVYTLGKSLISNVNVKADKSNGNQAGQLILLSKDNLAINRINEFNPLSNGNITSLNGFFYTEDRAELFGVGSMFYIDGGLFAKKKLIINAIRGDVDNEKSLLDMVKAGGGESLRQENKYSRFNVKYNKEVLLRKIDALPLVDSLQVIPDQTTIQ